MHLSAGGGCLSVVDPHSACSVVARDGPGPQRLRRFGLLRVGGSAPALPTVRWRSAPAVRDSVEKKSTHPVLKAFQDELYSKNFSRDEVRERVNMPPLSGITLNDIYNERRLELSCEGHRFFDLVRTEQAQSMITDFTINKNELFPLPLVEIDLAGGNWSQNTGY